MNVPTTSSHFKFRPSSAWPDLPKFDRNNGVRNAVSQGRRTSDCYASVHRLVDRWGSKPRLEFATGMATVASDFDFAASGIFAILAAIFAVTMGVAAARRACAFISFGLFGHNDSSRITLSTWRSDGVGWFRSGLLCVSLN